MVTVFQIHQHNHHQLHNGSLVSLPGQVCCLSNTPAQAPSIPEYESGMKRLPKSRATIPDQYLSFAKCLYTGLCSAQLTLESANWYCNIVVVRWSSLFSCKDEYYHQQCDEDKSDAMVIIRLNFQYKVYLKTFPSQSAKLALETSTKGQDTSANSEDNQTKVKTKIQDFQ